MTLAHFGKSFKTTRRLWMSNGSGPKGSTRRIMLSYCPAPSKKPSSTWNYSSRNLYVALTLLAVSAVTEATDDLLQQYFPGQFDVRNTIRDPWLGATSFDSVTFTNHSSSSEIALPDKRLLRFHASISTILRKTHARRVLDRTIKEAMHLEHLAENGSTDARSICMVLMTRVKTAVPYLD